MKKSPNGIKFILFGLAGFMWFLLVSEPILAFRQQQNFFNSHESGKPAFAFSKTHLKIPPRVRETETYLSEHPRLKRNLQIEILPAENGFESSWLFYDNWPVQKKDRLERFYQLMKSGEDLPLPEITLAPRVVNGLELFRPSVVAYSSTELAIDIYLAQVAHILYLDMNRMVPWTLEDFSRNELSRLFMSSNYFQAFRAADSRVYAIVDRVSFSQTTENILEDPRPIFEFMSEAGILGETGERTAMNLGVWLQNNLHHWGQAPKDEFYRNHPFLSHRLMRLPTPDQGNVIVAIEGCWSASRLFVDLMRAANLPVKITHNIIMNSDNQEGHHAGLAFNWQDGLEARYLIHTDGLYAHEFFYDPMPANGDAGAALWNYLWLNPNDFSQFSDYVHDRDDVFAMQSWEEWQAYYRYASIAMPTYSGINLYAGLNEGQISDILINEYGVEQALARTAARNLIQTLNQFGDTLNEALDTADELHLQWQTETGK